MSRSGIRGTLLPNLHLPSAHSARERDLESVGWNSSSKAATARIWGYRSRGSQRRELINVHPGMDILQGSHFRSSAIEMLVKLREVVERSKRNESLDGAPFPLHHRDVIRACFDAFLCLRRAQENTPTGDLYALMLEILHHNVYTSCDPAYGKNNIGVPISTYRELLEITQQQKYQLEESLKQAESNHAKCLNLISDLRCELTNIKKAHAESSELLKSQASELSLKIGAIERLKHEISQIKQQRLEVVNELTELERCAYSAELEKIAAEREARIARNECNDLMTAHDIQRRLLAKLEFDPSSVQPPTSLEWLRPPDQDDIHIHLEKSCRLRDELEKDLIAQTKKVKKLEISYRKENQLKNSFLQELSLMKEKFKKLSEQCEEAMSSRTPRPSWNAAIGSNPDVISRCTKIMLSFDSSRTKDKVSVITAALEEEIKESSRLAESIKRLGRMQGYDGDLSREGGIEVAFYPVRTCWESTSRSLVCLGDHTGVPSFLRGSGTVRNMRWSQRKIEDFTREVWQARRLQVSSVLSGAEVPVFHDCIQSFLRTRYSASKLQLEAAYNFIDGLERFRWVTDCYITLEVIKGRLHEAAYDDSKRMIAGLSSATKLAITTSRRGQISKSRFLELLAAYFPLNSSEDREEYRAIVYKDQAGFYIDVDHVLRPNGPFVEVLADQYINKVTEYQRQLRLEISNRAVNETVTLAEVKSALMQLDCNLDAASANLLLSSLFSEEMRGSNSFDERIVSLTTLADKLFRKQFIKPSRLYTVPEDMLDWHRLNSSKSVANVRLSFKQRSSVNVTSQNSIRLRKTRSASTARTFSGAIRRESNSRDQSSNAPGGHSGNRFKHLTGPRRPPSVLRAASAAVVAYKQELLSSRRRSSSVAPPKSRFRSKSAVSRSPSSRSSLAPHTLSSIPSGQSIASTNSSSLAHLQETDLLRPFL